MKKYSLVAGMLFVAVFSASCGRNDTEQNSQPASTNTDLLQSVKIEAVSRAGSELVSWKVGTDSKNAMFKDLCFSNYLVDENAVVPKGISNSEAGAQSRSCAAKFIDIRSQEQAKTSPSRPLVAKYNSLISVYISTAGARL